MPLTLPKELEEQGYTARVHHKRVSEDDLPIIETNGGRLKSVVILREVLAPKFQLRERKETIAPRGGYTKVEIFKGEEIVAEGEAWCNPNDPSFNKKLGRDIALGRALKVLKAGNGE